MLALWRKNCICKPPCSKNCSSSPTSYVLLPPWLALVGSIFPLGDPLPVGWWLQPSTSCLNIRYTFERAHALQPSRNLQTIAFFFLKKTRPYKHAITRATVFLATCITTSESSTVTKQGAHQSFLVSITDDLIGMELNFTKSLTYATQQKCAKKSCHSIETFLILS